MPTLVHTGLAFVAARTDAEVRLRNSFTLLGAAVYALMAGEEETVFRGSTGPYMVRGSELQMLVALYGGGKLPYTTVPWQSRPVVRPEPSV